MNTETHNLIGQLLDSVIRGLCIGITIAIAWLVAAPFVRFAPRILQTLGVWP